MTLSLSESQLREVDENNRKAKAILGCLVRAIQMSDETEIDVAEMVLAAFDFVQRNDRLLGG